jgi:hypothetical protein
VYTCFSFIRKFCSESYDCFSQGYTKRMHVSLLFESVVMIVSVEGILKKGRLLK